VVPEKQGLKQPSLASEIIEEGKSLSSGSRKTRIETSPALGLFTLPEPSKQWFQKNKD